MAGATSSLSIIVGASVGAALAGLGSVQSSLQRLSLTTEALKAKQATIGSALKGLSDTSHIAKLQKAYDDTGKAITHLDTLRTKMAMRQQKLDLLSNQRAQLRQEFIGAAAMGAAAIVPVKLAIDYESAMADVRKVVDFKSPEGFKKLSDDLLGLTRIIPKTAVELAGIAASGGQLGVVEKDLKSFTATIAKMSVAFDMSTESAGDSMAKLANIYKIPITQIGKLGDAINELSNQSPAKASDIVTTLGRVGGVAKQFGLTEMGAASLANAFISLGKPPEVAGTAINAMLTKLATAEKGGKKFQGALKSIGLSASELKTSIGKDAQGALVGFLTKIESIPEANRTGVLVDLFGLEYADDISVLTGAMEQYRQSIVALDAIDPKTGKKRFEGSMDKEFAARSATTIEQLRLFKNWVMEIGINIGSAALPALNDLVQTLRPVVNGFADLAKANPKVVSGLVQLVAGVAFARLGFIALKYGVNLVMSAFHTMAMVLPKIQSGWLFLRHIGFPYIASGIARVGSALWTFVATASRLSFAGLIGGLKSVGTAFLWLGRALIMNPLGLIITGIAVGGLLIYKYWQPIKGFFVGIWDGLKLSPEVKKSIDWVSQKWQSFKNWAGTNNPSSTQASTNGAVRNNPKQQAASPVKPSWWQSLTTPVQDTGNKAQITGQKIGTMLGVMVSSRITSAKAHIQSLSNAMQAFGRWVASSLQSAQTGFNNFVAKLSQAFNTAKQRVSQFVQSSIATLKTLPARFMQAGQEMMQGLINGLKSKAASVLSAITELGTSIKAKFTGMMQIQSPSRVFMGYGNNIGEGARLGVVATIPKMQNTMTQFGKVLQMPKLPKMASNDDHWSIHRPNKTATQIGSPKIGQTQISTIANMPSTVQPLTVQPLTVQPLSNVIQLPKMPSNDAQFLNHLKQSNQQLSRQQLSPKQGGQTQPSIVFSPQITINTNGGGQTSSIEQQVQNGLQNSYDEFQRLMRRYQADQGRVAFG